MDATSKIMQCAKYTPQIENLELCQLMNDLAYERMERKQIELFEIHDTTNRDWNLTMLIVLFRYLGGILHNRRTSRYYRPPHRAPRNRFNFQKNGCIQ
mgnify:CR=1 FL=1